jgi:hypothetical protein
MPLIKKRLRDPDYSRQPGYVILLPVPTLGVDNFRNPRDVIGKFAADRGISHGEAVNEAIEGIGDWLTLSGMDLADFTDVLESGGRGAPR